MSNDRIPLDAYFTDPRLVDALGHQVFLNGDILEPCAGTLKIARRLSAMWTTGRVWTADIDPQYDVDRVGDALDPETYKCWPRPVKWVVTNPPFSILDSFLPIAWEHCETGMALLLRLSALEPTKGRGTWLKEHQRNLTDMIVFGQPRPQYRPPGRDSVTTAWFVWMKGAFLPGCSVTFVTGWKERPLYE